VSHSDPALIWQTGTVQEDVPGRLRLEFAGSAACARCASGKGCGAGLFSGLLLLSAPARLPLPAEAGYRAGQHLRAGIRPRRLVIAALLLYLLPVLAFVTGVLLADALWPASDGRTLVGGLLACAMLWLPALAMVRRWPVQVDRIAVCPGFPEPTGEPGRPSG